MKNNKKLILHSDDGFIIKKQHMEVLHETIFSVNADNQRVIRP